MAYKSKKQQSKSNQSSTYTDSSFERSIGQLTNVVQTLTNTLERNPPNPQNSSKPPKPTTPKTDAYEKFENSLGNIGNRMFKGIDSMFGPKASKKLKQKMFDGFSGKSGVKGAGKSLLSGGLKGMGGNLAGLAGSALKVLGPLGAVYDATKKIFDFINSGAAAQAAADFGAIFQVDTSKTTEALFKASEKYREIIADFNILEPIKQANQLKIDGLEFAKSVEMDEMSWKQSVVKDLYDYEMGLIRDRITFSNDQAAQSLDANLSRNKTLFTNSMGYMRGAIDVSERALMAIGSSTQAVLDTVKEVGVTLGASLRDQVAMATSAQGLGVLFGASADDVLTMSKTFRLMDKSTARQALNMVAGVKAYAKLNGMSPAQLHKEMADSQEEIFKYTNYTSIEYAKQVVLLKNMNTSMSSMMKASDTMVLNYKDSMKAEMSLGAMIGQNVDLSETRALLMSGEMGQASSALKSALGGIDIGAMNPFAKQQLSQATGMGIDELMNLMSGKEQKTKGQLEAENAAKTGAAIANGALKQDINNAAAKLALEQAQRKKLLEFEQIVRKNSLMIEQAQRLQNLAVEQKWRMKFAIAEKNGTLELAIGEMQKEAAKGFFANILGTQRAMKLEEIKGVGNMSTEQVGSTFSKERDLISGLTARGVVKADDPKLAEYAAQFSRFEISKNLKDMPKVLDYFGKQLEVRKEEVKKNVVVAQQNKVKADEKVKANTGFWTEVANFWSAGGGIQPGGAPTTAAGVKQVQKQDKNVQDRIALAASSKAQKVAADRAYSLAVDEAGKMNTVVKSIDGQKQKIEDLKKQNSDDSGWLYKQNNTLIGILSESLIVARETALQGEKPINLDGKVVNKQLLNRRETQYGLGPRK